MDEVTYRAFKLLELATDLSHRYSCSTTEALMIMKASDSTDPRTIEAFAKVYFPAKDRESKVHIRGTAARQQGKSHMYDAAWYERQMLATMDAADKNIPKLQEYQSTLLKRMIDELNIANSVPIIRKDITS